jgi:hypothetical protein
VRVDAGHPLVAFSDGKTVAVGETA